MSFTRKHYEETARIIRTTRVHFGEQGGGDGGAHQAIDAIASDLSRMFASDNPRFDAARFAKACEPKGAK